MNLFRTLAFTACLSMSLSSLAQVSPTFNPDYDGSGAIGTNDLLGFLSTYGLPWEGATGTEGCTYLYFLEYDPAANIDDGSCATLDELICDYSLYSLTLALPGGAYGEPLTVPAFGSLQSLDVTLDFGNPGGDGSWASDLRLEIGLPDGSCAAIGGYDVFGECTDLGNGETVWGVLWNAQQDGVYTATVNLSDAGLSGTGLWSFTALNGYATSASVNYGITLQANGLCSPATAVCSNPDALGVCGGSCSADADGDGICDDVDPCVGELDTCGVCNGPGAIYDCGCSGIPAGDCDCNGTPIDAIGVCGGSCSADADADGICDDVDPCVGMLDSCGVCNGPGAIYDCGCSAIPTGDCNCNGNQIDALGVCGGSCTSDADGDGICDDGCTDPSACNFNPDATVENGSCLFPSCDGSSGCNIIDLTNQDFPLISTGFSRTLTIETLDMNGQGNLVYVSPGDLITINASGTLAYTGTQCPSCQTQAYGRINDVYSLCLAGQSGQPQDNDGVNTFSATDSFTAPMTPGVYYMNTEYSFQLDCLTSTSTHPGFLQETGSGSCTVATIVVGDLPGIPPGDCDCNGNQPDALGVCGGSCSSDSNGNGICDDVDPYLFQCGNPISYQGYSYSTVLIGNQCWFAENLRSANYENGDAIPSNLSDAYWSYDYAPEGAVTVYAEFDEALAPVLLFTYGRLYNGYAVNDWRGLCPSGWHVPTDDEWTVMTNHLGGATVAGGHMKTTNGWDNGGNGTNSSGFSGLPGGWRLTNGSFLHALSKGYWWSSSPTGPPQDGQWWRRLNFDNDEITRGNVDARAGFSVRCIKDAP